MVAAQIPDPQPALIHPARVVQLRAMFSSMRRSIVAAQQENSCSEALLFELNALAEAGIALADGAVDEATT